MAKSITTGSILRRSFQLFGQAPGLFFSIILILYSPLTLLYVPFFLEASVSGEPAQVVGGAEGWVLWGPVAAAVLLFLMVTPAASAAIAYGVVRKMRHEPVTLGECFRKGFRRWVSVVGASILIGLLTLGGFVLCILPGIIAVTGWFVAVPALVVEEIPATDGMERSWNLTGGHRLSIFGVVFVFFLLQQLTEIPSYLGESLGVAQEGVGALVLVVLTLAMSLVFTAVQSIASAVAYHDLRVESEGFGLEEIAAAFD